MKLYKLEYIVREASAFMNIDNMEVTQKDGYTNIVTSADVAVQDFLYKRLSEELPDCGFICEEEDMHDTSHQYIWIIDPIDGTQNFSRGIRECAISVGLKKGDEMELGVVFLPRTGELFSAQKGKGAFLNGRPIHVSKRPFADAVICTAMAVYHKEYAHLCSDIIVDTFLECNDVRRFGAAAPELCYLALGHCELYFELLLSPWDFAAASLILTEAGGVLSNLEGKPLTCLSPSGVLAANNTENLKRLQSIVKKNMQTHPIK